MIAAGNAPGPDKLRVAFINSTRKWGGVKTWTLDFGRALQDKGVSVLAIVRRDTPFVEACLQAGFGVHAMDFGFDFSPWAIARVAAVLRREKPNLAVVNISKDITIGAVAARICGIPVLRRVGLSGDIRRRCRDRLTNRFCVKHILVPSNAMRSEIPRRWPWVRPENITFIPNSKSLKDYSVSRDGHDGEVVFGVSSQLLKSKNHVLLLESLAELKRRRLTARLAIAGSGPAESYLRRRAGELGVAADVEFIGFSRDIPGFLRRLDAFVLPSLREGFPNTLLEALFSGLPVVAFALDGIVEMVDQAGLLVPPGDGRAFTEAMARLAGDPELRLRLGNAARCRAEEYYDLDANADKLVALCGSLAAINSGVPSRRI